MNGEAAEKEGERKPDPPQERPGQDVMGSGQAPVIPHEDPASRQQTLQPSLVRKGETQPRKLPLPRSFVIATLTILATITAGIIFALYLGKITKRGVKPGETIPELTPVERSNLPLEKPSTPSVEEDNSRFDQLLIPEEADEATPTSPVIRPIEATPSP